MRKLVLFTIVGAVVTWMWMRTHRNAVPTPSKPAMAPVGAHSTVHPGYQLIAEDLLGIALEAPSERGMSSGTVIAANHLTDEVIVYATKGNGNERQASSLGLRAFDPFLYALAIERGYTGASLIPESSTSWVTLREALNRHLSNPSNQLLNQIGTQSLSTRLKEMDLRETATVFNLVNAFATLARGGRYRPLQPLHAEHEYSERQIFSPESATIVTDILARAESKEVVMPENTAAYADHGHHEGWAIVYNFKYIIGVWLSDASPTSNFDASTLPARLARDLMNHIISPERLEPLPIRGSLRSRHLCRSGLRIYAADGKCVGWTELMPGKNLRTPVPHAPTNSNPYIN